jgi:diacylglycerol kinase
MLAFFRSFRFAARGLYFCLGERSFRFHLALSAYMYGLLLLYDWFALSKGEWALLVGVTALVLAAEAINTALEWLVDLVAPEIRPLAGKIKDAGAGAVLICALAAVAAGVILLAQPAAFRAMAAYYAQRPLMLGLLLLSLCPTAWFVFHQTKPAKQQRSGK